MTFRCPAHVIEEKALAARLGCKVTVARRLLRQVAMWTMEGRAMNLDDAIRQWKAA